MKKIGIGETKKIAADLPVVLYNRLSAESNRQMTNKSTIIRKAVAYYLDYSNRTSGQEDRNHG